MAPAWTGKALHENVDYLMYYLRRQHLKLKYFSWKFNSKQWFLEEEKAKSIQISMFLVWLKMTLDIDLSVGGDDFICKS